MLLGHGYSWLSANLLVNTSSKVLSSINRLTLTKMQMNKQMSFGCLFNEDDFLEEKRFWASKGTHLIIHLHSRKGPYISINLKLETLNSICLSFQPWKKVKVFVTQSCPTLCDPMDCSPPGSSVHGILQARILEWAAISFSKTFNSNG